METSGITNITSGTLQQMTMQVNDAKDKTSSFEAALDDAIASKDKTALRKACVSFESYYIQMMLKEMRTTVHSEGGIFPKSNEEKIFEDMLDEEVSKEAAKGRGIGIADMMYNQMSKNI